MKYNDTIILKDGRECLLRHVDAELTSQACEAFKVAHSETDFLLTYPDETDFDIEKEQKYFEDKAESENELEICAIMDGRVIGTAGIEAVGGKEKIRHRAEFGISIEKGYWGLGIGKAMTLVCIDCARRAGYVQLELDVVADNDRAYELYKSVGFKEFGRNPKGFRSRSGKWQELVLMRLELTGYEE